MARLMAMVYGKPIPVREVREYGEYEVSIAGGPWERMRYAMVTFPAPLNNVTVSVPLEDLYIEHLTGETLGEAFARGQEPRNSDHTNDVATWEESGSYPDYGMR